MPVDPELSAALICWTGLGETSWPSRSGERLASRFGKAAAQALLPRIQELEADFYATDAAQRALEPKQMGELAIANFAPRHPELSDDAVEALAWCYTFDFK